MTRSAPKGMKKTFKVWAIFNGDRLMAASVGTKREAEIYSLSPGEHLVAATLTLTGKPKPK